MPRKNSDHYTQISAQVEVSFRDELESYCIENNIKISDLIRQSLRREIGYCQAFHQASDQEKMLKIIVQNEVNRVVADRLQVVDATIRKIN